MTLDITTLDTDDYIAPCVVATTRCGVRVVAERAKNHRCGALNDDGALNGPPLARSPRSARSPPPFPAPAVAGAAVGAAALLPPPENCGVPGVAGPPGGL